MTSIAENTVGAAAMARDEFSGPASMKAAIV